MTLRLALIGCSKQKNYRYERKRGGRVLPAELYSSQLFRARLGYVESRGVEWCVVSAFMGLWRSNVERKPWESGNPNTAYDITMSDLSTADRAIWPIAIAHEVAHYLWEPSDRGEMPTALAPGDLIIELHAGRDYCEPLGEILRSVGITVETPVAGLGIGEQLGWYKRRHWSEASC